MCTVKARTHTYTHIYMDYIYTQPQSQLQPPPPPPPSPSSLFLYTSISLHPSQTSYPNEYAQRKKKNTPESGSFFSDPCNAQGSTSHIANSRTHHPSQPDSIACPLSYFSLSPIAPLLCPSTHSVGRTAATHNIKNLKRSRRHPRGARASSLDT